MLKHSEMTVEQKQELAAGAQAGLAAKRAAGAHLRRDFLDSAQWDRLARRYGIRLPQWHISPNPGPLCKWLKKLKVSTTAYLKWCAGKDLKDCRLHNQDWPLRAEVGNLLEQIDVAVITSGLRVVCDEPEADEEECGLPAAHVAKTKARRDAQTHSDSEAV